MNDGKQMMQQGSRISGLATAICLAVSVTACATDNTSPSSPAAPAYAASVSGNYLAGRFAHTSNDIEAAADYYSAALGRDPEGENIRRRTLALAAMDGRIAESEELAHTVLDINPSSIVARLLLTSIHVRAGRYAAAEKTLAVLPASGPTSVIAPLFKSWSRVGQGYADEALETVRAVATNDGLRVVAAFHEALIHDVGGDVAQAETHYLKAAENSEGITLRVAELLGNLYERSGRPADAMGIYLRYKKEHPASALIDPFLMRAQDRNVPSPRALTAADGMAEAMFGIASSYSRQNSHDTAMIFGQMALFLKPDFSVARLLVAEILEEKNHYAEANDQLGAIAEGSPFRWTARIRAAGNLDELDRTDDAVALLRQLAREQPARYDALIELGDILRHRSRFGDAVGAYDDAVSRMTDPKAETNWTLHYYRGIALERSGDWDRAEADFLRVLDIEPEQPLALNYLGYSWVERSKNLDQARSMIEKAVELRPHDGYIVDSLGWVLYQLGDTETAVRHLEKAVELRPGDPVINDHLGDAYWKIGRQLEAGFQWRRALSLDPEPDTILGIERKIKRGLENGNG